MRTQLLLVSVIIGISFNAHLQRRLADVTKASCEAEGKDFQEAQSAQCKAGSSVFEVAKKEDCKAGTWTEGSCSLTEIKTESDCKGKPTYVAAVEDNQSADGEGRRRSRALETTPATCTTTSGYSITTSSRLESQTACEEELKWTPGYCSTSKDVKSKSDCEKENPEFIAATEATCVEKKTDSLSSLSFNIALVLIICLLF